MGARPGVVAGEIDMIPSQGREEPRQVRVRGVAILIQNRDGAIEVGSVPENDGCGEKVQP